ncbi:MAG: LysR family transcriptional regulator [Coriobacteriia bacterium]|nr:LysR family transcriptional regulator [Coriobacteriia bacterium]
MNLSHLHYFTALAEEGHFSNAAKSLFVARSTLSLAISQLERELGAPLFTKNGSAFTLTPYGQEFYRYASLALQDIETGRRSVAAMMEGDNGTLRLGVPFTMQNPDWSHMIRDFHEQGEVSPNIEITQGFSEELLHELSVGNLDLSFAAKMDDAPAGLTYEPYWTHELVLVVNKDNPLASAESVTMDELKGLKVLSYREGSPLYDSVKDLADQYEIELEARFRDEITICSLVSSDKMALGLATYSFLIPAFTDVVCIPIEGISRDFHQEYLVYRSDDSLSGVALRFLEYAKNHPMPKGYLPRS